MDEADKRHILQKELGCARQEVKKVSDALTRAKQDLVRPEGDPGGEAGGQIVAQGTPEQVAKVAASHTGRFLKEHASV